MKFKYYNIFWVFLSLALLIIIFTSIDIDENRLLSKVEPPQTKNGTIKTHTSDGTLKTMINYVNGEKHGKSYLYYRDGKTVQLEMTYQNGKRDGVSKKYFESGELYAETPYKADVLHGDRTIYYKSGKLKAVVPYGYGFPGLGIEEYLLNGTKKDHPMIQDYQEDSKLYLSLSKACRDQKFYIGKLIDDKYLNVNSEDLTMLTRDADNFYIDLDIYTPSYLQFQDIICSCKTSQGNPMVLKRRINTSSLKMVN